MQLLLVLLVSLIFVGFIDAAVNPKWILPKGATAEQIKARDEAMLATLSKPAQKAFAQLQVLGKQPYNNPTYVEKKDEFLATLPKSVRDEILNFGQ